jgi:hypothetical protein
MVCDGTGPATFFRSSIEDSGVLNFHITLDHKGHAHAVIALYSDVGPLSPLTFARSTETLHPHFGLLLYWLLIGGMLAICLYNAFLWLGAGKLMYRINVLYLFSMLLLNFIVGRGFMTLTETLRVMEIDPDGFIRLMNALNNASGIWTAACVLYFSTIIVDLEHELPWLNRQSIRLYKGLSLLAVATFAYVIITNDVQKISPLARHAASIGVMATISQLVYLSIARRHFFARIFACAYAPLVFGALTFVSFLDGHLLADALTRNAVAIGSFVESLLLSFTVGYRMSMIETSALAKAQEFTERLASVNEDLERKVQLHVGDLKAMLQNIREAVFMLDMDASGKIWLSEEKSDFTSVLFPFAIQHECVPFHDFLSQLELSGEQRMAFYSVVVSSLREDRIAFEMNEGAYPRRTRSLSNRDLDIVLHPIAGADGQTERILCAVSDVTEQLKAEAIVARSDRENRIVLEILKLPIQKAQRNIEIIAQPFLQYDPKGEDKSHVMRLLHTAKGLSRTFFYDLLSETLHELEGLTIEGHVQPLQALDMALTSIKEYELAFARRLKLDSSAAYADHQKRWNEFLRELLISRLVGEPESVMQKVEDAFAEAVDGEFLSEFMVQFQHDIHRIAHELHKEPCRIQVLHDRPLLLGEEGSAILLGIMGHLLRNSMDHGIEDAQTRALVMKPASGLVTICVHASTSQSLRFDFHDDGRGVDLNAIRSKARQAGLEAATSDELAEALFMSGLSRLDKATLISGRGVGLDAVRDAVVRTQGFARARLGPENAQGFSSIVFEIQIGPAPDGIGRANRTLRDAS